MRTQSLYAYVLSSSGGAAADIRSHPSGPEYSSYFGGDNDDTIWYNMDRIAGDLSDRSGDRTISCSQDSDPANLCGANSGKQPCSCPSNRAVFLICFIHQVSSPTLTSSLQTVKSPQATSVWHRSHSYQSNVLIERWTCRSTCAPSSSRGPAPPPPSARMATTAPCPVEAASFFTK
jgi:hypothetical protein